MIGQPPFENFNFKHEKEEYNYKVFSLQVGQEPPSATFGHEGDIAKGSYTWVRYSNEWKKAEIGMDGRPIQRHPLAKRRCLHGSKWKYMKAEKKGMYRDLRPHKSTLWVHWRPVGLRLSLEPIDPLPWTGEAFMMPPHTQNILPENEWLKQVLLKWNSPHIESIPPLHTVGKDIITKLLHAPAPIPPVPEGNSTIIHLGTPTRGPVPPSVKLAIVDLLEPEQQHPNVCEFLSCASEQGVQGIDVLASIINQTTYCEMSPERRLYGALDIPMSKRGLGLCQYAASPYNTQANSLIPKKVWTTTLTPPGGITHTHMDYYGRHQYMVHMFGCKLWLFWPPTPENLKKFAPFHTQFPQTDLTSRCIDELEGLQVLYCTGEQAFVVKPNVFHACLSIGSSGHCGTWVWRLPEYNESFRMVSWGVDWMRGKLSTDAPSADYEGELDTLQSELDSWKELIKLNPQDPDYRSANDRLQFLAKELSDVAALFSPICNKKRRKVTHSSIKI